MTFLALGGFVASTEVSAAATVPNATAFAGTPTVGALFAVANGALASHFCSASTVDSPAGDLVITAAHCLEGRATGSIAFVPGYHAGKEPFGVWSVSRIVTDPRWSDARDPDDDFAFLTVERPLTTTTIESVTGAEKLAATLSPARRLTVIGYPDGSERPITCSNRGRSFSATQIEFDCAGYTIGTSGGPILVSPTTGRAPMVIGVIGGYEKGGDTDAVSYAAKFKSNLVNLYRLAIG